MYAGGFITTPFRDYWIRTIGYLKNGTQELTLNAFLYNFHQARDTSRVFLP